MLGLALAATAALLLLMTAAGLGETLEDDVEAVDVLTTFPYAIPPLLDADDKGLPFSLITHRLKVRKQLFHYATLQSVMNIKLIQQRFCNVMKTGITRQSFLHYLTIQINPCFKSVHVQSEKNS